MKQKQSVANAATSLKTREEVAGYLATVLETGDVAAFEVASAKAQRALKKISKVRPAKSGRDWYLKEWMAIRGLSQLRVSQLTGWSLGKVNEIYHSATPFRRDTLNVMAEILDLEPYELLLHPDVSQWMRQLLEVARAQPEGLTASRRELPKI